MVDPKWIEKYPWLYKNPDGTVAAGNIELDDTVARIFAKVSGYGGMFSTWSERHAFLAGAYIGYHFVTSSADIPPVPDFWIGDAHYFNWGITLGRMTKKWEDRAPDLKAYIALFMVGGVSFTGLLKLIGIG